MAVSRKLWVPPPDDPVMPALCVYILTRNQVVEHPDAVEGLQRQQLRVLVFPPRQQ